MPFRKIEDGTDDTEGNGSPRLNRPAGTDHTTTKGRRHGTQDDGRRHRGPHDTEGNRKHIKISDGVDDSDDTEGNKQHFRVSDGIDEGDDTEGNKKNFR